jgi:hypothetical protein
MEDALISPEGFMILSGAGLIEADEKTNKVIYQHVIETTDAVEIDGDDNVIIYVDKAPHLPSDQKDNFAYVMIMKGGEPVSEPFIPVHDQVKDQETKAYADMEPVKEGQYAGKYAIVVSKEHACYGEDGKYNADMNKFEGVESVLVDYYTPKKSGARQIEITADKFGGNYYLEASTLFRDTNGVDMPAEFIVPNCKIQSNFTFTMASSGDPSTFTFTMDAFPDYTRFDRTKKVLAAIQIIDGAGTMELHRHATAHEAAHDDLFI